MPIVRYRYIFVCAIAYCAVQCHSYLISLRNFFSLNYDYDKRKKKAILCNSVEDWDNQKDEFIKDIQKYKYLGLDCEWETKGCTPQKVALLQLATESGACMLLRLSHMNSKFPVDLLQILEDNRILKLGVACCEDAQKLLKDYAIEVKGCVDLRFLFTNFSSLYSPELRSLGLQSLAHYVLKVTMSKQSRIRCGPWAASNLSLSQMNYAVKDAVISVDIFKAIFYDMLGKSIFFGIQMLFVDEAELIPSYWDHIYYSCKPFLDRNFKLKIVYQKNGLKNKQGNKKKEKIQKKAFNTITKPPYDNCLLLAPDDQLLCTCQVKKAMWYVNGGRGIIVQENPLIVKLNFEPQGRPTLDGAYYTYEKENRCVVCGTSHSLLKKHIVPHEYRKYFPALLKSHSSHDIVLLCFSCNLVSNNCDSILRKKLADECNAPIGTQEDVRFKENPKLKEVRSAARALLSSQHKLPKNRLEILHQKLATFSNISSPVSEEVIRKCAEIETNFPNDEYISHGEKVINCMSQRESQGLLKFEQQWREHFVNTMNPKFLPVLWSSDHGHKRIIMQVSSMNDDEEKEKFKIILGIL